VLVNIAQGAEMPDLGCVFILPVYWVILTIAVPLIWLVFELQRTSASEKPLDWAKWHLSSEPEQAPANLNRVLEMQKAVILVGTTNTTMSPGLYLYNRLRWSSLTRRMDGAGVEPARPWSN
jgi:hypothetical protein